MLCLHNISKKYSSTVALDDVSISFQKAKVTSIYGPNGAGKSTLVKIICGEVNSDYGTIEFKEKVANFSNYKEALRAGISYVPQDFGLLRNLTTLENIAVAQNQIDQNYFFSKKKVENFITTNRKKNLSFPKLDIVVENLSAYEQQLVAIHKALFVNSELLIFDESTTNINPKEFQEFRKVVNQLKEENKTIVFISHKLDEVLEISDVIIIIKDGKIVKECANNQIAKEDIIKYFITSDISNEQKTELNVGEFLCELSIHEENLPDLQISINKGEIISINTRDTALNQLIGYKIFESLNKRRIINVGIIPASREDEAIFPNLTVLQNLLINAYKQTRDKSKDVMKKEIQQLVVELSLKYGNWDQNINELSGGNKQKIIFGRWILGDFDLLVLIEPTSGIDIETKGILNKKICELKNDGKSFILISTDEGEHKMLMTREISLNY